MKKKKKRLAIKTRVNVYKVNKKTSSLLSGYLLETKDMGESGLFLKTPNRLPKGTILKLEIELLPEKKTISVEGKVAWIAKKSQRNYYPGVGIHITRMSRDERRQLSGFLKNKFQNYRHALELQRMYLQLKVMAARLYELEESHRHAEHFRRVIDGAVKNIDQIAHVLDKEVWEIKNL